MNIRNRIIEQRLVTPDEVAPNPRNWRTHPQSQRDALRGILGQVGIAAPVIAYYSARAGNRLMLIDGHERMTVGVPFPCAILDVDDAEADTLLATFDPITAMATANNEALDALLRDVTTDSPALTQMLAELAEDAGLYADTPTITEDDVPEPPVDPITKPGDLWILGEHRLLCGDSTKPEDVNRLTSGQEIGVVHADPPYGMNVNTHFDGMFGADPSHRKTGARFDAVIGDETTEIAIAAMRTTPECASQFWWGADYYRRGLPDGGGWFVWDKRWNDAGMDLDSVAGNCFELCWSKHAHKRRVFRITWSGHHGMQKSDTKSRVHPNQKPVQLVAELLALVGGIIYDPFLGSGTTLIAAEQLGRKCYGMEISPAYCDVIVKRWETLTGKKAVRVPLEG
jgi:hypothetical protein